MFSPIYPQRSWDCLHFETIRNINVLSIQGCREAFLGAWKSHKPDQMWPGMCVGFHLRPCEHCHLHSAMKETPRSSLATFVQACRTSKVESSPQECFSAVLDGENFDISAFPSPPGILHVSCSFSPGMIFTSLICSP